MVVLLAHEVLLAGTQKKAFSVVSPEMWNFLPLEIRLQLHTEIW